MSRRIALFTGNYVNILDGVALTLNRLVGHLRNRGHEVVVFGPDSPKRALEPTGEFFGLPAISAPLQPEYRLALQMDKLAKHRLDRLAPEIVHIATPDIVGLWAQRYAKASGIPPVTSFHSNIVSYLEYVPVVRRLQPLGWRYFRYFYERCLHTYVPTQSMADELAQHGISRGVRLWERGVDLSRFSPTHRDNVWRREKQIGDDELVILFVGRLRWEKGLDLLAKVLSQLSADGISHRAVIVGEGVAQEALMRRLPQAIFTGTLAGKELANAYANADIFFFPSAVETFGSVTLEAMASGVACLCADAPGSRSVAKADETALLAPPDNVEAFSQALRRLIRDAKLRQQLAASGLERAQLFSWETANDRLIGHYEDAINRNRD